MLWIWQSFAEYLEWNYVQADWIFLIIIDEYNSQKMQNTILKLRNGNANMKLLDLCKVLWRTLWDAITQYLRKHYSNSRLKCGLVNSKFMEFVTIPYCTIKLTTSNSHAIGTNGWKLTYTQMFISHFSLCLFFFLSLSSTLKSTLIQSQKFKLNIISANKFICFTLWM